MKELKLPSTLKEQIQILRDRNLIINNEEYAERVLYNVNYYRLSAYGLGLHEDDTYKENIMFERLYRLYEFDVKFRYILLQAIEITEIMFRTQIAYHMAIKYNNESYLDAQFFCNKKLHNDFVELFKKEKYWQRSAAFIKHHDEAYGGRMPIWVAVEVFSFGMLSRFYGNMKMEDQWAIARNFATSPLYIRSWLKCLVEVRNICAHYGRIYNRVLPSEPKMYSEHKHIVKRRIFATILVLRRLISDVTMQNSFTFNIRSLVEEYSDAINLSYIGFPKDWDKLLGEYIETE